MAGHSRSKYGVASLAYVPAMNRVWSFGFASEHGQQVKYLTVTDETTREGLSLYFDVVDYTLANQ
jgi:hypothetical protein